MKDDILHIIAYGAILTALIFWPSLEIQTACASYGTLIAVSVASVGIKLAKRKPETKPHERDLREGLPSWPLAQL